MSRVYQATKVAAAAIATVIPDDEQAKINCVLAGITLGLALADADMFFFERWIKSVIEAEQVQEGVDMDAGLEGLKQIKKIALEVARVR